MLLNAVRVSKAVVPSMVTAGRGSFVNISTFGAVKPDEKFPISDESSYITGQNPLVDGGLVRRI